MRLFLHYLKFYCFLLIFSIHSTAFSEKLTIGVEKIKYLPYYTTEEGIYSGFAYQLFIEFGKKKGL